MAKRIVISSGTNKKAVKTPPLVTCQKSYPPSSEYLCAKDRMSEARPLPSQTTTGTGGSSRRYSRTMETTFGPPSTTRPTTGTPCPSPATHSTSAFRPRSWLCLHTHSSSWNVCLDRCFIQSQCLPGDMKELGRWWLLTFFYSNPISWPCWKNQSLKIPNFLNHMWLNSMYISMYNSPEVAYRLLQGEMWETLKILLAKRTPPCCSTQVKFPPWMAVP